ncbi:U3 small nucleolar RNA-associated protein 6-domain-containing protein [Coniella lustricola]|uniref:U3 small nucleolar RNA-associated protein 6-domain-containing protein n=1 Tax=Coniella lustricola TaxID=2025994 RepID=A0A2T2ZSC3_9PEZI|nr:U3 small nucleolar RNA-associated protein 6-domain-containing protein [Coniella lustricola]
MSNVADKARFHLERAVPQLREFEEKEIFSKEEIRTIVSKRTAHEHLVLGPGCKSSDFQTYIAWELSLDRLRQKRCIRKKIKHSTSHAANARIFNIYERGVFRHPGSLALWKDYLEYAARVKATKRWRKIVTRALRLHPAEVSLWVMAAGRAAEDGDVDGARSLFMRGCRFCSSGCTLWVEYARMEMQWLAKMERKNKGSGKKGHEGSMATHAVQEGDIMMFDEDDEDDEFGQDDDNVLLPEPSLGTQSGKAKTQSNKFEESMKKIEKSPALEGAIPRAIFDVARKQAFWSADAGEAFFDMFSEFVAVSKQSVIIEHVLDALKSDYPSHPSTCSCVIRQPLIGVEVTTVEFPKALREVLARIKMQTETTEDKAQLAEKTLAWVKPLLARKDLDDSLRTVLEYTKSKLETS